MDEQDGQDWVAASERMPDYRSLVFVFTRQGRYLLARKGSSETWNVEGALNMQLRAPGTFWRHLPAPPKGYREEGSFSRGGAEARRGE